MTYKSKEGFRAMCESAESPSMSCAVSPDILGSSELFPSIVKQGLRTG